MTQTHTAKYTPNQALTYDRLQRGLTRLPEHMRDGAERYVMRGIPPGSFMTALFSNDFMGAVGRADDANREALVDWAAFLYNDVPSGCYGGPAKVNEWIASGGVLGNVQ